MKKIISILFSIAFMSCSTQIKKEYRLETSDISNFWIAFDSIKNVNNKKKVFKELYLDKASDLFKEQIGISGDMQNVDNYLKSFKKHPKFWESLRKPTLAMQNISDEVDASFKSVKKVYPEFKPGDVCVFISPMIVQGKAYEGKILLGAELNAPLKEIDLSEFEEDISFVYQNDIKSTIIHETIHLQQKTEPETLLGHTIREGSADFLAELFLNKPYINAAYHYGRDNEEKLWQEFSKEMHLPEYSKWLYGASKTDERPADLGYFIGYLITKSYYEKANNKELAIKEIIEVSNFKQFLEKSNYSTKFSK